jgi:hypothetical protein
VLRHDFRESRWSGGSGRKRSIDSQNIFHDNNYPQGRHEQGRMFQPGPEPNRKSLDCRLEKGSGSSFSGVDITGGYCYGTCDDDPDSLKLEFEPLYTARSASPRLRLVTGPTSEIGREESNGSVTVHGSGKATAAMLVDFDSISRHVCPVSLEACANGALGNIITPLASNRQTTHVDTATAAKATGQWFLILPQNAMM